MQFYDATNKRAICQKIDRICDSDDTSYPRLDKTADVNDSLEEIIGDLINKDGVLQFDDTNYTSLPRGKGTLVEGQEWFSYAAEYLKVEEIHILDLNFIYRKISQIDEEDLNGLSWEEYFGRDSSGNPLKGFPEFYDALGDSIRLGQAPTSTAVTLANGIQIVFKRTAQLFTAVSTTAADTTEPGIPSPYHALLCWKASLNYCMNYKKDRVPAILSMIEKLEKKLFAHMSKKNPDRRPVMKNKEIQFI